MVCFTRWAASEVLRVALPCLVVTAAVWPFAVLVVGSSAAFFGVSCVGSYVIPRLPRYRVAAAAALAVYVGVVGAARLLVSLRKAMAALLPIEGEITVLAEAASGETVIPSEFLELGSARRAELLARVRATLVDGTEPDARTAAITALLSASANLHQFDPEIPWTSSVIHRAKELENGNWGAAAAALHGLLQRGQRFRRLLKERPACGGELHPAARAHEERGFEGLLELADLMTQGRQGNVEAHGCTAEGSSSATARK
ncbi:GPP34 family phosphoprotein [Nonomuraea angiospora]